MRLEDWISHAKFYEIIKTHEVYISVHGLLAVGQFVVKKMLVSVGLG